MNGYDDGDAFEQAARTRPRSRRGPMAARPAPYLDDLNPAQRAAVEALEGPVLMLAGAGTGKTRALTARIAHLLNTGTARPNEILAVTFTNKAAREMKIASARLLGQAVEGMPWLGTFHAICVKLLRRHAELVGLKSNFTILDTDDQIRLLKQLIVAENIDEKRWPARQLAGVIDGWKNRAWTPDKVPAAEAGAFNHRGTELYAQYQERLKDLNAVDFGDLLLHVLTIFQDACRRAGAVPALVPLHPRGRVPGHQRRAVHVAAPAGRGAPQHLLRGRRRPVDLRLARGRGRQHPAVREGLSRRQGHPAGAELPLDPAHPRRRLRSDRRQRGPPGQDPLDRRERGREGPPDRPLGRRGRGALDRRGDRGDRQGTRGLDPIGLDDMRDPRSRVAPDARLRGSVPDHRPALPRHRRPPLLRADGDPRRDGLLPPRRRRPTTTSPSSAIVNTPETRARRQGAADDPGGRTR